MPSPQGLRPTPYSPRYPEGIEEWIDVYGHAVPLFIDDPVKEYEAFRTHAGALEYSMLYKWHVEGPDAVGTADAVVSRNVRGLSPGRMAYGVVVDDDGLMVDDVTVAVHEPGHVVVTGGNPRTEKFLVAHAPAGTVVTERRDETAVLSLQGPQSRSILRRLTSTDVSNQAFPYYSFLLGIDLAGIPAQVNRVGFTAELGYELVVPRDRALELLDAVLLEGTDAGVRLVGAAALMMCRVEAGMIMGELEYDHTLSPFECRMGWAVDFDKGPFQGRDALWARKDVDPGRVVTIRLDGPPDDLDGAELLLDAGLVGHITMAVPSPALGGATVALARVHRDASPPGTQLTVSAGSGERAAEVVRTPVYDPDRHRVRS